MTVCAFQRAQSNGKQEQLPANEIHLGGCFHSDGQKVDVRPDVYLAAVYFCELCPCSWSFLCLCSG